MAERGTRGTRRWSWQQTTFGELVAEFLGTFVIIAFGALLLTGYMVTERMVGI